MRKEKSYSFPDSCGGRHPACLFMPHNDQFGFDSDFRRSLFSR